ncbi:hypothetical protein Q7P37_010079 [Cladosporium fusiforme]
MSDKRNKSSKGLAPNSKDTTKPPPQRKAPVSPAAAKKSGSSAAGTTTNRSASQSIWDGTQHGIPDDDTDDESDSDIEDNDALQDDVETDNSDDDSEDAEEVDFDSDDASEQSEQAESTVQRDPNEPRKEVYVLPPESECDDSEDDMFEAIYFPMSRRIRESVMQDLEEMSDEQYQAAFNILLFECPGNPGDDDTPAFARIPLPARTVRALRGYTELRRETLNHPDAEAEGSSTPAVSDRDMRGIEESFGIFSPWEQDRFFELASLHSDCFRTDNGISTKYLPKVLLRLLRRHIQIRIDSSEESFASPDAAMEAMANTEVATLAAPIVMTADVPAAPMAPIFNEKPITGEKSTHDNTTANMERKFLNVTEKEHATDALAIPEFLETTGEATTAIEEKPDTPVSPVLTAPNAVDEPNAETKSAIDNKRKRDEAESEDDEEPAPKKRAITGSLQETPNDTDEDVAEKGDKTEAVNEPSVDTTAPSVHTNSRTGETEVATEASSKQTAETQAQNEAAEIMTAPAPSPKIVDDETEPPEPKITRGGVEKPASPLVKSAPKPLSNADKEEITALAPKRATARDNRPTIADEPASKPAPKRTRAGTQKSATTNESDTKQTTKTEGTKKRSNAQNNDADAAPAIPTKKSASKQTTETQGQKSNGTQPAPVKTKNGSNAKSAPTAATEKTAQPQNQRKRALEAAFDDEDVEQVKATKKPKTAPKATNGSSRRTAPPTKATANNATRAAAPPRTTNRPTQRLQAAREPQNQRGLARSTGNKANTQRDRVDRRARKDDSAPTRSGMRRVDLSTLNGPTKTSQFARTMANAAAAQAKEHEKRAAAAAAAKATEEQQAAAKAKKEEERMAATMAAAAKARAEELRVRAQPQRRAAAPPPARTNARTTAATTNPTTQPVAKPSAAQKKGDAEATVADGKRDQKKQSVTKKTAIPQPTSGATRKAADTTDQTTEAPPPKKRTRKATADEESEEEKQRPPKKAKTVSNTVAATARNEPKTTAPSNKTAIPRATLGSTKRAAATTNQTTDAPRPKKRGLEKTSDEESGEEKQQKRTPKKAKTATTTLDEQTKNAETTKTDTAAEESDSAAEATKSDEQATSGGDSSTNSNEEGAERNESPRKKGVARLVDPKSREKERKRKERDTARRAAKKDKGPDGRKYIDNF